jgi:DNA mismatch repair protein MutS2
LSTFALTRIGAQACQQISPWLSRLDTEHLLDQTAEALHLEHIGVSLQGIHNLLPYLERAELGGILQSQELQEIALTLATARSLRRKIDDEENLPKLKDLVNTIRTYPELEQAILTCLDEQGNIRDSASETLRNLKQNLRQQRATLLEKLQRLISTHSSALQETVITQREGRYVLPLKATHKDVIRGLVHDSSSSGATLYTEPYSIVEGNNKIRQLQGQIRREEERILKELSLQVGSVSEDLEHLQMVMVKLDMALARARYSLWLQGNRPVFRSDGLCLRQVRHPLLLWKQRQDPSFSVIPVDFRVSTQIRVIVVTGPNTGGKTVALKTLGLMILMAKAGLFIPAREPVELPWFDHVLVDIGDEQSLQQSLSTFSGHIRRISRILNALTPSASALVLLDEVGAGTDPTEGSALATALLTYLGKHARLTMATTHYGDLKSLKYQDPSFENASVEFDETTLAPTYRLLWGIPGRSNALAIAERLELDPSILEEARHLLQGRTEDVNTVILGLEQQRAEMERKTQELEGLHQELETLRQQMLHRSQRLYERETQLDQQKADKIQSTIQSARGQVASVIRRLQKGEITPQQAGQALDKLESDYQAPPPPPVETEFYPEIGDRVRLRGLDQIGEVISINGEEWGIRSGILKFTVQRHQLLPLDEHQEKKRQRPKPVQPLPPPKVAAVAVRTSRNTFDLRGKTVVEGESILEKAFSEVGSGPVWIIHGHGTGKLRAGIHQFLQSHPRVQSFTAADPQDGGTGVTVASLRS